jgi:hypothetical protein
LVKTKKHWLKEAGIYQVTIEEIGTSLCYHR